VAKFMVLYRSTAEATEQLAAASPEQAQEGMEMWLKWAERVGPSLVDMGSPVGNSRTLPGSAETGVPVGGYSLLEADSAEAVTTLLEDHPHLQAPGAVIEVLEYLPLPGM